MQTRALTPCPALPSSRLRRGQSLIVTFLLALLLFPISSHAITAPSLTPPEQEAIQTLVLGQTPQLHPLRVLKDTTSLQGVQFAKSYDEFCKNLRDQAKDRSSEFKAALEDFLTKNKTPVKITMPTNGPARIELISDATVKEIFSHNTANTQPTGWALFYQKFPGSSGLITVSRVGFDPGKTTAIVYMGEQSHYLAGHGRIRVLKREGKKWVEAGESIGPMWVS